MAHDSSTELLDLVHTLLHTVRRETMSSGANDGVTPGQLRFLRMLQRCDGPQRPGELAARLDLAPRSVTTKVDLAAAEGLVERRPDPTDRRATLIALTPAAEQLLDRVVQDRAAGAAARLARLTAEEQAQLLALLHRIVDEPGAPR
ncbi:MAG: MarR family transcriptional regulator [Actinobacteria bacterium]|nr:MarR family transcriptional regulator [Actinomycetota bacterium]MCG2802089.1 MarR family transcriptional regulator [Cellulomonas sp.]